MKRLVSNVGVALLTFSLGVLGWLANPVARHMSWTEPLQVSIVQASSSPLAPGELPYVVTVKNVSDKTIRGYSLGFSCNCRGWDSYDQPYSKNRNFMNPVPDQQRLKPGESQSIPFTLDAASAQRVWVDLVHFEHGDNWGPNEGHKEGYVRE